VRHDSGELGFLVSSEDQARIKSGAGFSNAFSYCKP